MKLNKVNFLNLGGAGIFVNSYYQMLEENFNINEHDFYLINGIASTKLKKKHNVKIFQPNLFSFFDYFYITLKMVKSKKIILHGMNDPRLIILLWAFPSLARKVVWVLWGGDLYDAVSTEKSLKKRFKQFCKSSVLKNIATITTTIPQDYLLASEWYGVKARFIENLMYESHIARDNVTTCEFKSSILKIQLGNSATKTNQHLEIINVFKKIKGTYILYAPLSYGDCEYRETVINYGKDVLGEKFHPITKLMSFEEYNTYMNSIDIAIFNHPRQQAMGNIIGMISLGKKVYLNKNTTPYYFFKNKGFIVGDISELPVIEQLTIQESEKNKSLAKYYFSKKNLIESWRQVLEI
jgi:hypothetical protein